MMGLLTMALINYCSNCGQKIENEAIYCPQCGHRLSVASNNSAIKQVANQIIKKPIVFFVCIAVIISSVILIRWNNEDDSYTYTPQGNNQSFTYSSGEKTDASSIFNNLKISNFSASPGQHGGKMSCEVLNNNSFTVRGYFRVGFYDKSGNLMYSQLMSLPSVASGEKVICSTLIPKDDYPTGYSYVKYSQASLTKD